jgi:hypothetical protein
MELILSIVIGKLQNAIDIDRPILRNNHGIEDSVAPIISREIQTRVKK